MTMKTWTIVVFLLKVFLVSSIKFSTQIQQKQIYCFSEVIPQSTPLHFKVFDLTLEDTSYEISLQLQNGTILSSKQIQSQNPKKIDSYTALEAQYKFCIQNTGSTSDFQIGFHTGIQLADITQLPRINDTKLIEQMVDLIQQQHTKYKQVYETTSTFNQYSMQFQRSISFKTIGFGFLSIATILIVSYLHYVQIKRVLRNIKII